jgi:hypothetical protein
LASSIGEQVPNPNLVLRPHRARAKSTGRSVASVGA